jgi:hypothetical protein
VGLFIGQPAALDTDCKGKDGKPNGLRPIIPICGGVGVTVLDNWPIEAMKPEDLKGPISYRVKGVGNALVGWSGFGGVLFKLAWNFPLLGSLLRAQLADALVKTIRKQLEDFQLLNKTVTSQADSQTSDRADG